MDKDHYNTLELISHSKKNLEIMVIIEFFNTFIICRNNFTKNNFLVCE